VADSTKEFVGVFIWDGSLMFGRDGFVDLFGEISLFVHCCSHRDLSLVIGCVTVESVASEPRSTYHSMYRSNRYAVVDLD
jgi:hypothetical protein